MMFNMNPEHYNVEEKENAMTHYMRKTGNPISPLKQYFLQ